MSTITRNRARTRAADLWGLAFSAMGQQKVRTTLTLIGVIVGTFALTVSVAVGRGVDRAILNLFREDNRLRVIAVSPDYRQDESDASAKRLEPRGAMSDAKRARIRNALARVGTGRVVRRVKLTADMVGKLESMEHVEAVIPEIRGQGKAILDGKSEETVAMSVAPRARPFPNRMIAGRLLRPDDGHVAVVHEFLLYRWGLSSDADAESAIGRKIRFEITTESPETLSLKWTLRDRHGEVNEARARALASALKRLAVLVRFLPLPADERAVLEEMFERVTETSTRKPGKTYSDEFTVVGVFREEIKSDPDTPAYRGFWNVEILIPAAAAVAFVSRIPQFVEQGYDSVNVAVDSEDNVKDVEKKIGGLGFRTWSLAEFIGTARMNVLLVSLATAFVALVALVVAAIGITNTMIMSVLERTHEIGIMKALGARDGHVRLIFIIEGVLMGLVGSGIGLLLGWLISFPGDVYVKSVVEPQTRQPVKDSLFYFPIWLVLGVPALVCLVTTLAAWYPAARAARVDPVTSLRHD